MKLSSLKFRTDEGKEFELPIDIAKKLYDELHNIFSDKQNYSPYMQYYPYDYYNTNTPLYITHKYNDYTGASPWKQGTTLSHLGG